MQAGNILLAAVFLASPLSESVFGEKLNAAFLSGAFLHRLEKTPSPSPTVDPDDTGVNIHVSNAGAHVTNAAADSLVTLLDKLAARNMVQLPQTKTMQEPTTGSRADAVAGRPKQTTLERTGTPRDEEEAVHVEGSGSDGYADQRDPGYLAQEGSGLDYNPL